MDPTSDLSIECGQLRDGKIRKLLEEMIAVTGLEIEFRDITLGKVKIRAFNPQDHGALEWDNTTELTMFSVDQLLEHLFERIGAILEESDFDEEHSFRSGVFYFNANVQTDLKGFTGLFDSIRRLFTARFSYLADIPFFDNLAELNNFRPFSCVLYGFLNGLPPEVIQPIWQFHWFMLEVIEKGEMVVLPEQHPIEWALLIEGGINELDRQGKSQFENIPRGLLLQNGLPSNVPLDDREALIRTVISTNWGGDVDSFSRQSLGRKLTCLVCAFYATIGIWVEISAGKSAAMH